MKPNRSSREEYVRKVLDAYRQTPGTTGSARRQDRLLEKHEFDRFAEGPGAQQE